MKSLSRVLDEAPFGLVFMLIIPVFGWLVVAIYVIGAMCEREK